ncbi:MAG: thioredoxin [Thermoanaerobaculaceae bacterium]|nr:thioredoxin [Thermoanaerobaculaceae bacterium]MDI9621995.1 thioredoxin [Acidobacteriota bacterium]NLH10880.1 thioredoxin [Holophagae bacterium]HPW54784.1 thioredoxin [Thermoanaerobaculaceae bacterium]
MAGSIVEVNDTTFEQTILKADKPAVVDFWATWCGPCKMIAPHVEAVAAELAGQVIVAKVDVDSARGVASRYGIQSIPTLLFFKGGQVVDRMIGGQHRKDDIKKKLLALI